MHAPGKEQFSERMNSPYVASENLEDLDMMLKAAADAAERSARASKLAKKIAASVGLLGQQTTYHAQKSSDLPGPVTDIQTWNRNPDFACLPEASLVALWTSPGLSSRWQSFK